MLMRKETKKKKKEENNGILHLKVYPFTLTLLHSERPKLYTILAFLRAIGLILLLRYILAVADLLLFRLEMMPSQFCYLHCPWVFNRINMVTSFLHIKETTI